VRDRGVLLTAVSTVWTGFSTWYLFRGWNTSAIVLIIILSPLAISLGAVFVRKGHAVLIVRTIATLVLVIWGVLLFAWMFLVASVPMAMAMADASRRDGTDPEVSPAP
jgi:hypothetical protein